MRKKQAQRLVLATIGVIGFVLGLGAKLIHRSLQMIFLKKIYSVLWFLSASLFVLIITEFLLSNRIYKGFRYFWYYWTVRNGLERQMLDAGFGIQRSYYMELPKIQLSFNRDFSAGTLKIRNVLKFDKKLDDVVMSAGLRKFIVERHYQSDDGNYYVYELVDGSVSFKPEFETFADFLRYNRKIPAYSLFLDKRSETRLEHTILIGQTGSGKSVETLNLLLQMLNKPVKYEIFFADPKGSSLSIIGNALDKERTAVDVDAIIQLLETFITLMHKRKTELAELLRTSTDINADYTAFSLEPYVFLFEEYAAFATVLASEEKKKRDMVKAMLYEVILQGRQLGFFLFLIMQKSDASLLDTALRENIPLKIVLGNSEPQTYVTAFGAGVDIPNRHYAVGEGVFTEPVLAPEPKLVQCPYCKFNILQACQSPGDAIARAPENKA